MVCRSCISIRAMYLSSQLYLLWPKTAPLGPVWECTRGPKPLLACGRPQQGHASHGWRGVLALAHGHHIEHPKASAKRHLTSPGMLHVQPLPRYWGSQDNQNHSPTHGHGRVAQHRSAAPWEANVIHGGRTPRGGGLPTLEGNGHQWTHIQATADHYQGGGGGLAVPNPPASENAIT